MNDLYVRVGPLKMTVLISIPLYAAMLLTVLFVRLSLWPSLSRKLTLMHSIVAAVHRQGNPPLQRQVCRHAARLSPAFFSFAHTAGCWSSVTLYLSLESPVYRATCHMQFVP